MANRNIPNRGSISHLANLAIGAALIVLWFFTGVDKGLLIALSIIAVVLMMASDAISSV